MPSDQSKLLSGLTDGQVAGIFDEAQSKGQLRDTYAGFVDALGEQATPVSLYQRQLQLNKTILDNGVTYNVYADAENGPARPWSLDMLPLIISAQEWASLSKAAEERARLLNLMMADIYGEQRLLREGLVPPALIYGDPGYLRPMHGHKPPRDVWLHLLALDLGRTADGRWWVVNHRTQAPSGLGYVLENRLTISRMFPGAFRNLQIQHIASFYKQWLDCVRQLSEVGEGARIALLTPGPFNETYFEHVYLARYLGITLVESQDLQIRDQRLYIKTVHGTERVHVLLRRVDDNWLDPLELRPDSQLGVAGLLQAVRAGHVLVVNLPGSGWLESPALQGFMPGVAKAMLGKELDLPSVPTWWCGEAPCWASVSKRLHELVIKRSAGTRSDEGPLSIIGSNLSPGEMQQWVAKIARSPERYTVQETLPLSTLPVWKDGGFERRSLMWRVYACSDGNGGYRILPGGLTRISGDEQGMVSMQRGGSSVDTWVISGGRVDQTTLLRDRLKAEDVRALRRPVSSRAAENLFWLGRYSERADYTLILLHNCLTRISGQQATDPDLLCLMSDVARRFGAFSQPAPAFPLTAELFGTALLNALGDPTGQKTGCYSLGFNLRQLSRIATQIRDRLSNEHWKTITEAATLFDRHPARALLPEKLARAQLLLNAISGEQSDHMTRDDGWRFLTLGRQLERLILQVQTLLALLDNPHPFDERTLEFAIALADSVITYRARYQHRFEWLPMVDLLIFDEDNPRSIARINYKVAMTLKKLPGTPESLMHRFNDVRYPPSGITLHGLQAPLSREVIDRLVSWLHALDAASHDLGHRIGTQYFRLAENREVVTRVR
jgi:uncharacterized circularly permuted ATP-grasp superfamily protein/uncharacterized alpha-E superfamily protein